MKTAAKLSKPSLLHRLSECNNGFLTLCWRQHFKAWAENEAPINLAYCLEIERIFKERGLPHPSNDKILYENEIIEPVDSS